MKRTPSEWRKLLETMRDNKVNNLFAEHAIEDTLALDTKNKSLQSTNTLLRREIEELRAQITGLKANLDSQAEYASTFETLRESFFAANQQLKAELKVRKETYHVREDQAERLAIAEAQCARYRAAYATCRASLEQLGTDVARAAIARARTYIADTGPA